MAIKVFISWSGELSRRLAGALRDWLPSVLQSVRPYFTPEDIEKGARWESEIAKELEACSMGILCITRENTESRWLLFEAGALSKSVGRAKVCPVLFDLAPSEIKGPLASFQATTFARDDFKRLVAAINEGGAEARLDERTLDRVFEMWWPKLEEELRAILASTVKRSVRPDRSDHDILEEILQISRVSTIPAIQRGESLGFATTQFVARVIQAALNVTEESGIPTPRPATKEIAAAAFQFCAAAGFPQALTASILREIASLLVPESPPSEPKAIESGAAAPAADDSAQS